MPTTVARPNGIAQDHDVVLQTALRDAIRESAISMEAIAAAMTEAGVPTDRFYVHKMTTGEKPITGRKVRAMPDEVEMLFVRNYAQAFGLLVIVPTTNGDQALVSCLSGLAGLLGATKARMAKAAIDDNGAAALTA